MPDLLAGGVAQALAPRAAPAQLGHQGVLRLVLLDQLVDLGVAAPRRCARPDRRRRSRSSTSPSWICASSRSPPVTATSRMFMPPKRTIFRLPRLGDGAGDARPGVELGDDRRSSCQWPTTIFRSSRSRGQDEPVLAVAVGRLVQVHEPHVDLRPGQLAIELRVQVRQRLLQLVEPVDPHLRGREGVHPGDHADALRRPRWPPGTSARSPRAPSASACTPPGPAAAR